MAIYSGKDMPKEAWPTSRAINALTGNNPIMSDKPTNRESAVSSEC
jgi:hypothetical protein